MCLNTLILLDSTIIHKLSFFAGSGVTTEPSTCHAARIMVISVIPLVIVQLPNVFKSSSGEHVAVLVSLVVSIALLLSYCLWGLLFLCYCCWSIVAFNSLKYILHCAFQYDYVICESILTNLTAINTATASVGMRYFELCGIPSWHIISCSFCVITLILISLKYWHRSLNPGFKKEDY